MFVARWAGLKLNMCAQNLSSHSKLKWFFLKKTQAEHLESKLRIRLILHHQLLIFAIQPTPPMAQIFPDERELSLSVPYTLHPSHHFINQQNEPCMRSAVSTASAFKCKFERPWGLPMGFSYIMLQLALLFFPSLFYMHVVNPQIFANKRTGFLHPYLLIDFWLEFLCQLLSSAKQKIDPNVSNTLEFPICVSLSLCFVQRTKWH